MAIDAQCPHCFRNYRLKEEFLGKKVKCANQDCRKEFPVAEKPKIDADTVAAAALSDEVAAVKPENKTIPMSCSICEHKWQVPFEMQTKNVLCPECKHRQKVPEQKAGAGGDWRTAGANKPSLAKQETLENVTSARDTAMVSGETLKKTGVIADDVEPVPLKVKLMRLAGVFALLLVPCLGGYYWCNQRKSKNVDKMFDEVVTASDDAQFKDLPNHRAMLRSACAEYSARLSTPEGLKRSLDLYNSALSDLRGAAKGYDRDLLTAEVGVSLLCLGGEGEEVIDKKKLTWMPVIDNAVRAQIRVDRTEQDGVMGQVRRVLDTLKTNEAELEVRQWAVRRLARELIARKQIQVLLSNLNAGFEPGDVPEVEGQIGLELLRAGDLDTARSLAERLRGDFQSNMPTNATSAQALIAAVDIKESGLIEPGAKTVSDAVRTAHAIKLLAKKDPAAALDIATRPGTAENRLKALAAGAEMAEAPGPFLEAAEQALKEPAAKSVPTFVLARLAMAASKAGDAEKATVFIRGINDAPLRVWLIADGLKWKWAAAPKDKVNPDDAVLPTTMNAAEFLPGYAWGRLQLARHNGLLEKNDLAKTYQKDWPSMAAPFGTIGVMLGVQDKALAP